MFLHKISILILLIILISGCASTTRIVPSTKYLPEEQPNVFPFFATGQPIASVQYDEAFLLLYLDPTYIAGRPYIRLWMLYQNNTDSPYLLEPLKFAKLTTTRISKNKTGTSLPESPTKILAHISDEKAKKMILKAIGGAFQEMAAKEKIRETKVYSSSSGTPILTAETTIKDKTEARAEVRSQTVDKMTNISLYYDSYISSINYGILRRNTVFPGQSVNGFIYFPFPLPPETVKGDGPFNTEYVVKEDYYRTRDYMHVISLNMLKGTQEIKFIPIEGE